MKLGLAIIAGLLMFSVAHADDSGAKRKPNNAPPGALGMPKPAPETCSDTDLDNMSSVVSNCEGAWHAVGDSSKSSVSVCCHQGGRVFAR